MIDRIGSLPTTPASLAVLRPRTLSVSSPASRWLVLPLPLPLPLPPLPPFKRRPLTITQAAMTSWQPNPESLNQLCGYLRDSLTGHDKNTQKNAEMVRRILEGGLPRIARFPMSLELPHRTSTPRYRHVDPSEC